uniref:(California timema) hypothetical protein n=1 Tax=Timema californicum TaxID=61474 RepID=A0A7R9J712_TIMCA|nr:unnamed protein product [Timema californicum]
MLPPPYPSNERYPCLHGKCPLSVQIPRMYPTTSNVSLVSMVSVQSLSRSPG